MVHRIHEISDVTTGEMIGIVGQYNHMASGGRAEIDPALASRGYTEAQLAAITKSKQAQPESVTVSCGLRFTRHLSTFKYPLFGYILTLFENYERGQLPFEGSVADQPAQIMTIFSIIQNLKNERERKLHEKIERENGRSKRQNQNRAGR